MPDAVLVLDLYAEEPVLGEHRLLREAAVSFGRPMVYPADHSELDPVLARRPDLHSRQFWVLHFPFDLEPPKPNRRYEAATITITFDDDGVVALDIMPMQPDEEADIRGIGRNVIAWDLHPADAEAGLRPRSRVMQVILDAPAEATDFHGALGATLTVARIRGTWAKKLAASQAPRRFLLTIDGNFTAEPSR